jgi:hypothetical protein
MSLSFDDSKNLDGFAGRPFKLGKTVSRFFSFIIFFLFESLWKLPPTLHPFHNSGPKYALGKPTILFHEVIKR